MNNFDQRDVLGRLAQLQWISRIRQCGLTWADSLPEDPYEGLDEPAKEVLRRIGRAVLADGQTKHPFLFNTALRQTLAAAEARVR